MESGRRQSNPYGRWSVAQCQGTTRKGDRCKRDAREGSAFCAIHQDQEIRARSEPTDSGEWDRDAVVKAAIGFALVGVILFWGLRR
jgi:hypothetical protein